MLVVELVLSEESRFDVVALQRHPDILVPSTGLSSILGLLPDALDLDEIRSAFSDAVVGAPIVFREDTDSSDPSLKNLMLVLGGEIQNIADDLQANTELHTGLAVDILIGSIKGGFAGELPDGPLVFDQLVFHDLDTGEKVASYELSTSDGHEAND